MRQVVRAKRIVAVVTSLMILAGGYYIATQDQSIPIRKAGIANQTSTLLPSEKIQTTPGKARTIQVSRLERSVTKKQWKRSDQVLRHRIVPDAGTDNNAAKLEANRTSSIIPIKSASPMYSGALYAHAPTPPGRSDFGQWVAKPIPEAEIIEKRQRLARGERLFKRVIIRRKQELSRQRAGGVREIAVPK